MTLYPEWVLRAINWFCNLPWWLFPVLFSVSLLIQGLWELVIGIWILIYLFYGAYLLGRRG